MDNYTNIVERQMNINRKRNALTLMGIIIGVVLFTALFEIGAFIKESNIHMSKYYNGDYDGIFYNLSNNDVNILSKNVEVKDISLVAQDLKTNISVGKNSQEVTIYSVNKNLLSQTYKDKLEKIEGKLPKSDNEIIIERKVREQHKKEIGDKFKLGNKEYIITGFFQPMFSKSNELVGITNRDDSSTYSNTSALVKVKANKDKVKSLDRIARDLNVENKSNNRYRFIEDDDKDNKGKYLEYNYELLFYYGEPVFGYNINLFQIIFGSVIFISIMVLIYASINSSRIEKMKQLSILRCIGATPLQIRGIIYKEALILGGLAIVPGILLGHSIVYILINIYLKNDFDVISNSVDVRLTPSMILIVTIITLITIIVSTYKPAMKASKVSPIEGVRGNHTEVNKKIKKRKSKLIRKILGIEGELAYKNLRSNNISFILTTLVLSVSLIMFIVFTGYIFALSNDIKSIERKNISDAEISTITSLYDGNDSYLYNDDNAKLIDEMNKNENSFSEINEKLRNKKIVKNTFQINNIYKDMLIENVTSFSSVFMATELVYNNSLHGVLFNNGEILVYDDGAFKQIEKFIQGEDISLAKFKDDGIIFINPNKININGKIIQETAINFKSGDNINLHPVDAYISKSIYENTSKENVEKAKDKTEKLNLNVIGTISSNNLINRNSSFNSYRFSVIISENTYKKYKDIIVKGKMEREPEHIIGFDFYNNEMREKYSSKLSEYMSSDLGYMYQDYQLKNSHNKDSLITVSIIVYSFASLTILISILNIINNRSSNILNRKKEFGMLMAIGMKKKNLIKSILFEGIISWIISCAISIPISYLILKILYNVYIVESGLSPVNIPIKIFIWGVLILLIISILTMIGPIIKFNKFRMVEMIKNEE